MGEDRMSARRVVAVTVTACVGIALLSLAGASVAAAWLGLAASAVSGLALARRLHRDRAALARLAEEVDVVTAANPDHRLDPGPGALGPLATAVNRLADARESARRDGASAAAELRREVESERDRLAELTARLGVAVVVCTSDGRILLYNETARSLVADPTVLGLGRTVFGLVDRVLLDHATQRLAAGEVPYTATTLHRGRLLRVHVVHVPAPPDGDTTGLALVLEDRTREADAAFGRREALHQLLAEVRDLLAVARSAAASDEALAAQCDRVAARLEQAVVDLHPASDSVLDEISAADFLAVVADRLRHDEVDVAVDAPPEGVDTTWLRADAHALAAVLTYLAGRVAGPSPEAATLHLSAAGASLHLDLRWAGPPPDPDAWARWLREPLGEEGAITAHQVLDRHGAEVAVVAETPGTALLRLRLRVPRQEPPEGRRPVTASGGVALPGPAVPGSRPKFYDFDLAGGDETPDLWSRPLAELACTVLDTETTGLDPTGGDRIVSIGAVRVLNGRVLRQECLETLVDPERDVPAAATAIHGLTTRMLAGAPASAQALDELARFAQGTVLVGHHIGFDLEFLRTDAAAAGPLLRAAALDTLLLHAALYPAQSEHTLEAIAARLGVSVVGRHTALGDALVTADVFAALLAPLREAGIVTLADAVAASRRAREGRAGARPPDVS